MKDDLRRAYLEAKHKLPESAAAYLLLACALYGHIPIACLDIVELSKRTK